MRESPGHWCGNTRASAAALCALWAAGVVTAAPVLAAESAPHQLTAQYDFDIPAQPLARAIAELCSVTNMQVLYTSQQPLNLVSVAVSGRQSVEQALRNMLGNSGFTFRFVRDGVFTLEKVSDSKTRVLGAVKVEGAGSSLTAAGRGVSGINGSTDATATEGTGSYTTGALTAGSKAPESMRRVPQSVTVVTQAQMQDQGIMDLERALLEAPGITGNVNGNIEGRLSFYSRGYSIGNFQVDGGAPFAAVNGVEGEIDMAQYDHVEVLRGPDGLFQGMGNPAGTVNLVRKKPLDHAQLVVEGATGSWNNNRVMIDGNTPLGIGDLTARAVVNYTDRDFFYDDASDKRLLVYGIVESNPRNNLALRAGVSYTRQDAEPFVGGMVRYQNGDDTGFPRSKDFMFPWNKILDTITEVFVNAEHVGTASWLANSTWRTKLNLQHLENDNFERLTLVTGAINQVTLQGPGTLSLYYDASYDVNSADLSFDGDIKLLGRPLNLQFGGRVAEINNYDQGLFNYSAPGTRVPVDVFDFDPADYPEPDWSLGSGGSTPSAKAWRYAGFLKASYEATDRLRFLVGAGASKQRSHSVSRRFTSNGAYDGTPGSGAHTDTPGADYHSDMRPIPYGAVTYDVLKWLTGYVSYTDIYSANYTAVNFAGDLLPPTHGDQYEAGLKMELADGRLNGLLSTYRITRRNFSTRDPNLPNITYPDGRSCCYFVNGQEELSRGVDAELSGELRRGLQITLGYTFNENFYKKGFAATQLGQPISILTPKHMVKLWSKYQLPGTWSALAVGFGVQAQTRYFSSGSLPAGYDPVTGAPIPPYTPYRFVQAPYAVLRSMVGYKASDHWELQLNVDNITNKTYYQTISSPGGSNWYGAPFNAALTVRGRW